MVSIEISNTLEDITSIVQQMKEQGILSLKLPNGIEINLNPIYAKPTNNQTVSKLTLEEKIANEQQAKEKRLYGNR